MNTLALQTSDWDLYANASGNIALLSDSSAIAQDVASAISTFLGEVYYDTTLGIPYLSEIFGQSYSSSLISSLLQTTALTVPGVVSVQISNLSFEYASRALSADVMIIDTTGAATGITFSQVLT
jgi:vacuolar-type H+-ATPase catalytic subunit A/Vma1